MGRLDSLDLTLTLDRTEELERLAAGHRRLLALRLALGGKLGDGDIGPPVCVLFEGADASGKGGAIKRLVAPMERARARCSARRCCARRRRPPAPSCPTRSSSERCSRSSICCFSGGRSATTRWRNSAVSSSSRSGDSTPLTTTLRASVCSRASSSGDSSLPVKTTTGRSRSVGSSRMLLEHLEARHVRQPQVEHHAVVRLLAQRCERLVAGSDVAMSMSSCPSSSAMLICSASLSSTTSSRLRARRRVFLDPRQRRLEPFGRRRLGDEANAPRARPCWRSSSSVTICTGMCRVAGSCLSWLSTVQPSMSGRNTSSETAVGWNSRASASASAPRMRHQHLEALRRAPGRPARARSADRPRRSAAPASPGCRSSRSSGIGSTGRSGSADRRERPDVRAASRSASRIARDRRRARRTSCGR